MTRNNIIMRKTNMNPLRERSFKNARFRFRPCLLAAIVLFSFSFAGLADENKDSPEKKAPTKNDYKLDTAQTSSKKAW